MCTPICQAIENKIPNTIFNTIPDRKTSPNIAPVAFPICQPSIAFWEDFLAAIPHICVFYSWGRWTWVRQKVGVLADIVLSCLEWLLHVVFCIFGAVNPKCFKLEKASKQTLIIRSGFWHRSPYIRRPALQRFSISSCTSSKTKDTFCAVSASLDAQWWFPDGLLRLPGSNFASGFAPGVMRRELPEAAGTLPWRAVCNFLSVSWHSGLTMRISLAKNDAPLNTEAAQCE